jgi:hypothetical protein
MYQLVFFLIPAPDVFIGLLKIEFFYKRNFNKKLNERRGRNREAFKLHMLEDREKENEFSLLRNNHHGNTCFSKLLIFQNSCIVVF